MAGPLIARLLLDAQSEFLRAADAVPSASRDERTAGLNTAGWVVAHAGFFHDVWINVDGQGKTVEECEPWLRAWVRKQDTQRGTPIETCFEDARAAVDRVVERVTPFLEGLSADDLDLVPSYEEGAWKPGRRSATSSRVTSGISSHTRRSSWSSRQLSEEPTSDYPAR